jgi:hypothetical protein
MPSLLGTIIHSFLCITFFILQLMDRPMSLICHYINQIMNLMGLKLHLHPFVEISAHFVKSYLIFETVIKMLKLLVDASV